MNVRYLSGCEQHILGLHRDGGNAVSGEWGVRGGRWVNLLQKRRGDDSVHVIWSIQ